MSKNCEPFSNITNHMVCTRVKLKRKLNFFLNLKRETKTGQKHKTLYSLKVRHVLRGGGRNVDDQNVDRPKISERRNGLFS